MQSHDDIKSCIEEWDKDVLRYIADVDVAYTHEQQVRCTLSVMNTALDVCKFGAQEEVLLWGLRLKMLVFART